MRTAPTDADSLDHRADAGDESRKNQQPDADERVKNSAVAIPIRLCCCGGELVEHVVLTLAGSARRANRR